jgi:hypothetical protein
MNPALSCIEDTLRLLLEEAKEAKEAAAKRGTPANDFDVGRSEGLSQVLSTWANQLQTFGIEADLNGVWEELRTFLSSQGY